MAEKKQIAFIINPISGFFHKDRIPKLIEKHLDANIFTPKIIFTEYAGHATVLAKEFTEKGFDYVVAVGGDGTVNETACTLRHTDTALGIIPTGSGNGLARHLHISLNTKKAIKQLNKSKVSTIDYGLINGKPFFCTCGVGFDAHISMEFCKVKKRGSLSYLGKILADFFSYKPENYLLKLGENEINTNAFLITICNSTQWGNAAHIAPKASVKDGYFDIVTLKKVNLLPALWLTFKLYTHRISDNKYIKIRKADEITITSENKIPSHLDGEPFEKTKKVQINVVPAGLKVFCAKNFQ